MTDISRCPTCKRRYTRSSEANRLYWLLVHLIAERIKPHKVPYSAESWHTYLKSRFLGCDEVQMPNRKSLLIPRSTAGLDVDEFSRYFDQVQAWAAEHNVFLEDMEAA